MAREDFLTGVLNSRAFYEMAQVEMARAARQDSPLSLAYIDLDDFKEVNDTLGHSTGDRVLQAVAATIMEDIRLTDAVARLGGDEFAILLSGSDRKPLRPY